MFYSDATDGFLNGGFGLYSFETKIWEALRRRASTAESHPWESCRSKEVDPRTHLNIFLMGKMKYYQLLYFYQLFSEMTEKTLSLISILNSEFWENLQVSRGISSCNASLPVAFSRKLCRRLIKILPGARSSFVSLLLARDSDFQMYSVSMRNWSSGPLMLQSHSPHV